MILFKEAASLTEHINKLKQKGYSIGFAPTMGALHYGHISLIEKSKNTCDITVSSIFINPTQFTDAGDFEKYPVTLGDDILLLTKAGCDVLFLPSIAEVYPNGTSTAQHFEIGEIEFLLEGKFRPGHFQGVCQVVDRLLNIVKPGKLFMGQKDYQQCLVVKRLVQLTNLPVDIITVETLREASGLAMSSRNLRLNEQQKKDAAGISKMLQYIKQNIPTILFSELEKYARNYLLGSGFTKVDYVSIADAATLHPVRSIKEGRKLVVLIAAFIGEIRLIDNVALAD
jgi:pantoate--beta-alanine ligase